MMTAFAKRVLAAGLFAATLTACAENPLVRSEGAIESSWASTEALREAGRAVIVSSVTVIDDPEAAGADDAATLGYASADGAAAEGAGPRVYSSKPVHIAANIVAGRLAIGSIVGESGAERFLLPLATLLTVGLIDGRAPEADMEVAPGEVLYIGDLTVAYGERDGLTGLLAPRPYTFTTTSNFEAAQAFLEDEHPALAGSLEERLLICRSCPD